MKIKGRKASRSGWLLAACCFGVVVEAEAVDSSDGKPRMQFETNFFDFGKIRAAETLTGTFKFKNTGEGILKIEPPQASCDCTEPKVVPDTLTPGQSGMVNFSIKLDRALNAQRHIWVRSNDPKNPVMQLTFQMDYTPLYELSPMMLRMVVPAGKDEAQGSFTVTRADGKPLQIDHLTTSQAWISAAFEPASEPQANSARINVIVHRPPGPPAPNSASIQMWDAESTGTGRAVRTVALSAEIQGELRANPASFYWVLPDYGKDKAAYPAESLTRQIALRSVLGNPVEIKKATSDIEGLSVRVVPKDAGKTFDLVLKFEELPRAFTNGKVTVETSLASLPKLEVPITVAVPEWGR